MDNSFTYLVLILLLLISALFSATETAYSTVNKIRLKKMAEDGNKRAKIAYLITERFDGALTTILIGNNIINIGASSLATVAAIKLFGEGGAAVATGAMTVLIVVGAEILPKSLANANSESWALKSAGLLRMLMVILTPLLYLFDKLNSAIKKSTSRQSIDNTEPSVTEQELKFIVENIEEEGVLEKQEGELVRSALSFDEKTVQEILTPRVDLECIDINAPIEENIKWILGSRYSRIPVYEGDSDEIIGILHTRRFLCELIKDKTPDLRTLITPAFFVYKTKNLSSLLTDFKHNKMHIAVVTDDYGGTLGIVTMEDLLEQLVGDIWDEDEVEKPDYVQVDNNSYIVSGDMPIRDMFEILDINIDSMEYGQKTMGGLALEMFTYIPKVGESFKLMGLNVTIKKMKENRIIEMSVKMDNKE